MSAPDGSGSGDPAGAGLRLTAAQIFAVATRTGEEELKRSSTGLGLSGLAAGLEMGLTGLGSAVLLAVAGPGTTGHLLASLLYPLGFIVVIVGRAQLFTENTLFPVVLVLHRRRHLANTLRLWAIVFATNVIGALLFALLAVRTPALPGELRAALTDLGSATTTGSVPHLFWSAVIGGWIIALMAWLVSAAWYTQGQVLLVYLMTFVVGAAHLAHCIAGSGEALCAVLAGAISPYRYLIWLGAATGREHRRRRADGQPAQLRAGDRLRPGRAARRAHAGPGRVAHPRLLTVPGPCPRDRVGCGTPPPAPVLIRADGASTAQVVPMLGAGGARDPISPGVTALGATRRPCGPRSRAVRPARFGHGGGWQGSRWPRSMTR